MAKNACQENNGLAYLKNKKKVYETDNGSTE
jgi:hypothetical protein